MKSIGGSRTVVTRTVTVVDANGILVRSAKPALTFAVSGPAELLGLGNGQHDNHVPGAGVSVMPAYNGHARAILRGTVATGAPAQLTVSADGLESATVDIDVV